MLLTRAPCDIRLERGNNGLVTSTLDRVEESANDRRWCGTWHSVHVEKAAITIDNHIYCHLRVAYILSSVAKPLGINRHNPAFSDYANLCLNRGQPHLISMRVSRNAYISGVSQSYVSIVELRARPL